MARVLNGCCPRIFSRAAMLAALLLWGGVAHAAWDLQTLMTELARTTTSEVRFQETKHLAALKAPLELRGILRYRRPDHLERHVQAPFEESFLVDGDAVTLTRKGGAERHRIALQSQPVLWAFIESIRATLRGDLAALQQFYRVELHGTREQWELTLLPRDLDMAQLVRVIRIGGRGGTVRTIEVEETGGDRSITRIDAAQ